MQQLIKKTEELANKAKKLVNENQKLHLTVQNLENEVQGLKRQLEEQAQKNAELNNRIKIIKLARKISPEEGLDGGHTAELKRKINEYIKELDNCISMLNE
jgi:predicted RNase H-like nuclease (RuvC/YqgF family)